MIAAALFTTIGFAFGYLTRCLFGRKPEPLKIDPLGVGAPTEPPHDPFYDLVFDGLCGYRRVGE